MIAVNSNTKFQRTYLLQIEGQYGEIFTIGSEAGDSPLLTLEFSIQRDILSSANVGAFRIKNINPSIRSEIGFDFFYQSATKQRKLVLKAGYVGRPLSTIFKGIAQVVSSYRAEGEVDFTTEIEGHDYLSIMPSATSYWTVGSKESPVTQAQIINKLLYDLQLRANSVNLTLGLGVVKPKEPTSSRYSYTASGFTWEILQNETGRNCYIDSGKVYVLPNNYVFEGEVKVISSLTGLLGTPRKNKAYLVVEMIFEPSLIPGQQVILDTSFDPRFNSASNGTYKVVAVQHSGVISSTVGGKCKTIATLVLINTPVLANFPFNSNPLF